MMANSLRLTAQNTYLSTVVANRSDERMSSERRIRNNRARRRREMHKNFLLTLLTICLAVMLAFSVNVILSNAKSKDAPVYYKYYTSIVVNSGDTLLSIAKEHKGTQYETANAYVKEVMQMNALSDDKIVAGQHLVIPYYSTQFAD